MNLEEFSTEIQACGGEPRPLTDSEWADIQLVYTWHPAIATKKAIAQIFVTFGIGFIRAMAPHASMLQNVDEEIMLINAQIDSKQKTRNLRMTNIQAEYDTAKAELEAEYQKEIQETTRGYSDCVAIYKTKLEQLYKKQAALNPTESEEA